MSTRSPVKIPVSVVIPLYNGMGHLRRCIESITQDGAPAEIIIVDDFSSDQSLSCAHALASEFGDMQVIERRTNGGAAAARLDGFRAAKNDWVAIVDADDFLDGDAIGSAYEQAIADGSDICIWDLWRYSDGSVWRHLELDHSEFPLTGREAAIRSLGGWRIHPLGVARKSLYLNAYKDFEETCLNADELITRLVLQSAKSVSFSSTRYFYRVNLESTTQVKSDKSPSVLSSHIWLINFSRNFPEVAQSKLTLPAISCAWYLWRQRNHFPSGSVYAAVSNFTRQFLRLPGAGLRALVRYPKYFFAFLYLHAASALAVRIARGK